MRSNTRMKILRAVFAASLVACAASQGGETYAQRSRSTPPSSEASAKRVVVRGGETSTGSRVTVTADNNLRDYSAYRSGDRFYVVLPKSAAGAARGGSGKGYSDMQVQQRGDSVVLSFRVQPGAKPRVQQQFNRLEVVINVPEGGQQAAGTGDANRTKPQPVAPVVGANQNANASPANQAAARAAPPGGIASANTDEKGAADAANRQSGAAQTPTPAMREGPTPNAPEPVNGNPHNPDATQLAQARQPAARDIDALSTNTPAPSLGATLSRDWVAGLLAAVLLVSLGLFLVLRRRAAGGAAKESKAVALKAKRGHQPEVGKRPAASSPDAGPPTLADGAVLQNRYRVVRHLGQGGMGAVYEAIDERLGRTVALKMTLARSAHLRRAFEREARILANLSHPALPRVIDHFGEGDELFLVMDYVPGSDLKALLKQQGHPFTEGEVLRWADELLDALEYLHSHEPAVVHRDIKPSNMKLTARRRIVLLDFGLAKGAVGQTTSATLSRSVMGYSPHFAPPEQMQGERTDPRSDLYSLAATLYHLLAGQVPPDAIRRLTAQLHDEPDPLKPLDEINPRVSAHASSVIMRALALKPAQRWPGASAMRAAFAAGADATTVLDSDTQQASKLNSSRTAS